MGIEPTPKNAGNSEIPAQRGTESGTLPGADPLDKLAAAIRNLDAADRAKLAAMLAQG